MQISENIEQYLVPEEIKYRNGSQLIDNIKYSSEVATHIFFDVRLKRMKIGGDSKESPENLPKNSTKPLTENEKRLLYGSVSKMKEAINEYENFLNDQLMVENSHNQDSWVNKISNHLQAIISP